MPNTLVHLGVQSVSTKALFRGADFKWIALGCIIPDIPWILKRIVIYSGLGLNTYDLTQYSGVQASLLFSILFCGAVALLTSTPGRIFLLLAANSLLHLLLDAMQIKWGNGVNLFAPFSWQLTGFNLLWPEHTIILFLTVAGLFALIFLGIREWKGQITLARKPIRYAGCIFLLLLYICLPYWLRSGPEKTDNYYAATFRNVAERPGKYIELDRSAYNHANKTVKVFSREYIKVTGNQPPRDAVISVQGKFTDNRTIHITRYHVHKPFRDLSSGVALAGIVLIWGVALVRKKITFQNL